LIFLILHLAVNAENAQLVTVKEGHMINFPLRPFASPELHDLLSIMLKDDSANVLFFAVIQNGKVLKQGNSEFNSDQAGTVLIKSNAKLSDEKKYVITYVATKELEDEFEVVILQAPTVEIDKKYDGQYVTHSVDPILLATCTAVGGKPAKSIVEWSVRKADGQFQKVAGAEGENSADLKLVIDKDLINDLSFICHVQHDAVDVPIGKDFHVPLRFKPFSPIFAVRSVVCTQDGSAIKEISVTCADDRSRAAKPSVADYEITLPNNAVKSWRELVLTPQEMGIYESASYSTAVLRCSTQNSIGKSTSASINLGRAYDEHCRATIGASFNVIIVIVVLILIIIIVVGIVTWLFREQIKAKFAKEPVDYDPAEERSSITPPPTYPATRLNSGVSLVGGTLKRENGGTLRSDSGNARLIVRDESDYVDTVDDRYADEEIHFDPRRTFPV